MTDVTDIDLEALSPMQRMIVECNGDENQIGERISAVLELLTQRAVNDAPFTIYTDSGDALCLFAANEDVEKIKKVLPSNVKDWDDAPDAASDFTTNADPGDEQAVEEDESEPTA